ncbi:MIP/aquaporin family protein [Agrococcus lahaulensis]|uniref:MIP/aquaporin family protein n=1 Tax=Agrococcus lahaulensis TaxID=341722 RepID=UPI003CCBB193
MLVLLGCGVVANVVLKGTKGFGGGFLMINFGWGLAVFAGVIVSIYSGAHINPAVTLGLLAQDLVKGNEYDWALLPMYLAGQFLGAFLGAVLCWLAYKQHFDVEEDPGAKLGTFSTGPALRSTGWNLITEIIGTFVLVFVVIAFGVQNGDADASVPAGLASLGALPVALLVVGIGASLGGPTGYAINPARDLGPRIAHAVLPIRGKGSSDWGYSWIPVVGPVVGGVLAGLLAPTMIAGVAGFAA